MKGFQEIRRELKKNEIPLFSIFGSTNENQLAKPPNVLIVDINEGIDFKNKLKLLRILSKFQLDGYAYFEVDEINPLDVYIGSYGFDEGQSYYRFGKEFVEFIQKDIEAVDLRYFEQKVSSIK